METEAATSFLKAGLRLARAPLIATAAFRAIGAGLMIVQYRLLASVVNDAVFEGADLDRVWPRLWPVLLLIALRAATAWGSEWGAAAAAAAVKRTVRAELMERLFALGPTRFGTTGTGALSTMLVDGVEALEPYYARFLPAMTTVALVPPAVLAAVLPLDWLSTLVLALTAPLIPLFMILIGRGAERLNQRQWANLARMSAHFLEAVRGLTTLKLFNASRREAEIVASVSEDYRLATMSVLRIAFLSALALEFFATLGVAVVAVFVGFRLLWGDMGFERGFFVLLVAPEFYAPLRSLGAHYHARMEAIAAAGAMTAILARPFVPAAPASSDPASYDRAPPAARATPPDIVFENVSLDYGEGRKGLDGAGFRIAAGCVTALVGPSGAGKSSIVNVLLGFAPATTGTVLVDGRPLADMNLDEWRQRIAWVPQRPHLFRGTVADNIRLGDPDACDPRVEEAARLVGAQSFIHSFPDGFGHAVAEGGGGLSGGQARLVALARAALRDAPVLILDEPTASLDRASERLVEDAVRNLSRGRTVLVIAHRLETVRTADSILVLDRGRTSERGCHDELMRAGGLYKTLVENGEDLIVAGKEA